MDSVDKISEKFVIMNAIDYGEAKVGPVMRMIMGAHPELRKEASEVKEIVAEKVSYINSLKKEEIHQLAQKQYPELLQEEVETESEDVDFIRNIINEHNKTGRFGGRVHTRFPPEPNGWLHVGHACSIIMNHKIAMEYDGKFNFRFDDTNPLKEEEEYVKAMIEDAKWLGVYKEYGDGTNNIMYGSNYFDQLYDYAMQLVKKGVAYVDDSTVESIREMRGTVTESGKESQYRTRSIEENIDLFERMKSGEFPNGAKVLRAKIDMAHQNMLMRDPIVYRILHAPHHNTGDKWCIYPMYDWAHGLEDSIEGITHSICTLEFEVHRPLYDWYIDQLEEENGEPTFHPQQIEFAKVNLSHSVLGKRIMIKMVEDGHVNGWEDPRMLTIAGMRKRGITRDALASFTDAISVSKREKIIDQSILDHHIREDLNNRCPRVMSVLEPLKIVITNYPENKVEEFEVPNHPTIKDMGTRKVKFTKELFIEQEDFMEDPPEDYYRLSPGKEVRLKYAYYIKCENIIKDEETGKIREIHCSYDEKTKGGELVADRDVKGTIHWISADNYVKAEARLFDRLFVKENPMDVEEGKTFVDYLNPNSLEIRDVLIEPFIQNEEFGSRYQFERLGYFYLDPEDSKKEKLIFNRIITLRDSWVKK